LARKQNLKERYLRMIGNEVYYVNI